MCGFLGIVGGAQDEARHVEFAAALDQIAHRGPDGARTYTRDGIWLGFRRLAILDLSDAGMQPFFNSHKTSALLFNGEIYNFVELKAELTAKGVPIYGSGDTAVLMAALEAWGIEKTLPKLNGFWAMAYVDFDKRTVALSRDRFGVKPLYFTHFGANLAFGSEPKALLATDPSLRRPNEDSLSGFLRGGSYLSEQDSYYRDIRTFPAAHVAIFEAGSGAMTFNRYWNYPNADDIEVKTSDQIAHEFRELFLDAVKIRYRADVPTGLTISGGIDSTAILVASADNASSIQAFTAGYGDARESEAIAAKESAARVGVRVTEVEARSVDWLARTRRLVYHLDSPTASPAIFPLDSICKAARESGCIVLLEGQGADEAFGGYVQHAAAWMLDTLVQDPFGTNWVRALRAIHQTFGLYWTGLWAGRLAAPRVSKRLRSPVYPALSRAAVRSPRLNAGTEANNGRIGDTRLRSLLLDEHSTTVLPGLLHYGDAVSMANGVEMRQPFLDYRLVEWIFRQANGVRIREGQSKWCVREFLRLNGHAEANARKKQGFYTPICDWIRENSSAVLNEVLLKPDAEIARRVSPSALKRLHDSAIAGDVVSAYHLFKAITAQLWWDECIDGR